MVHATLAKPPYRVDIVAGDHALIGDESKEHGGGDAGPAPFDLVLSGLAACTLITLRMYAERKGWTGFECTSRLRHHQEGAAHFIDREVEARGVPDAAGIERLRDIVERTPVTLALKGGFSIATVLTGD